MGRERDLEIGEKNRQKYIGGKIDKSSDMLEN
jgi:hypothetical protein